MIRGGTTNKSFLTRASCARQTFEPTRLIPPGSTRGFTAASTLSSYAEVALIAAAIEGYEAELDIEAFALLPPRRTVDDRNGAKTSGVASNTTLGISYSPFVSRMDVDAYRIDIDGHRIDAIVERFGDIERDSSSAKPTTESGDRARSSATSSRSKASRTASPATKVVSCDPAPAVVVNVLVKPGDVAAVGDPLVVLEAMKMEMAVEAKFPRRVATSRSSRASGTNRRATHPVEPTEERTLTTQDIVRLELFQALAHQRQGGLVGVRAQPVGPSLKPSCSVPTRSRPI